MDRAEVSPYFDVGFIDMMEIQQFFSLAGDKTWIGLGKEGLLQLGRHPQILGNLLVGLAELPVDCFNLKFLLLHLRDIASDADTSDNLSIAVP